MVAGWRRVGCRLKRLGPVLVLLPRRTERVPARRRPLHLSQLQLHRAAAARAATATARAAARGRTAGRALGLGDFVSEAVKSLDA